MPDYDVQELSILLCLLIFIGALLLPWSLIRCSPELGFGGFAHSVIDREPADQTDSHERQDAWLHDLDGEPVRERSGSYEEVNG